MNTFNTRYVGSLTGIQYEITNRPAHVKSENRAHSPAKEDGRTGLVPLVTVAETGLVTVKYSKATICNSADQKR